MPKKEDKKKDKKEDKKESVGLENKVNNLEARVRRMTKNWKRFCKNNLGSQADDGKIEGNIAIALLVGVLVVGMSISAFAGSRSIWSLTDTTDTAVFDFTTDDDGTGDLDLKGGNVGAGSADFSGNVTITGTVAVTGDATFSSDATVTSNFVANGTIDTDSITVDAGSGIDNQSAGILVIGAATATSVEIADASVNTDIQGPLVAKEDIQSDEIDSENAATLLIGKATATKVEIADASVTTDIEGPLVAKEDIQSDEIDSENAAALLIGKATATSVEIADSGVETDIQGTLSVDEAATFDLAVTIESKRVDAIAGITPTAAAGNSTNYLGAVHYDIFNFTNVIETFTDGSDEGESAELMTFPEGRILFLSAAVNSTVTCGGAFEASANDIFYTGIGTVAAADDATLSGTEQDIIAVTTHDTVSGGTVTFEWETDMTAGGDDVFDGTASAVKLFFNAAVADTSISADVSITNIGTLNVIWVFLGDD